MRTLIAVIVLSIAINAIVIPNAQREFLAVMLGIGAVVSLLQPRAYPFRTRGLAFVSFTVTCFYCLVGQAAGAEFEAIQQALIIYVASPLLWMLVIDLTWRSFGTERIVIGLGFISLLAAFSVAVYYLLYRNFGAQSVAVFGVRSSNIHIKEGYAGAIMHVPGSLIFLSAGFFGESSIIRNPILRISVLIALSLAVLATGRTAAVLALLIGCFGLLLGSQRQTMLRALQAIPFIALTAICAFIGLDYLLGLNAMQVLQTHFAKAVGGDIARPEQIAALVEGAIEHRLLGAGHGIGVAYQRSVEFPWRYEAVYFALLLKLGLVGVVAVLSPILLAIFTVVWTFLSGRTEKYDIFFGSALCASFVMGTTNPYMEGFTFQWMYLIPVYYFLEYRPSVVLASRDNPGARLLQSSNRNTKIPSSC